MTDDTKLLEFAQFVTDKFTRNHSPWVYTRDLGDLKHIRYTTDYTGYDHWRKRLKRFLYESVVSHWSRSDNLFNFMRGKSFWHRMRKWPLHIGSNWRVLMRKASNLPDGRVGTILTHWEEDGEYIMLFGPTVGREVLKFVNAEPDNEHAKAIVAAMSEAARASGY
jgi:hypothetical protein